MPKSQYSELTNRLKKAQKEHRKRSNGIVGKCNDNVLKMLIALINKEPELENFIAFVQTLNFFYSTRLQTARGNKDETIIKAARLMKHNWNRGINFIDISRSEEVKVGKVEQFRKQIQKNISGDYYSFATKVFHMLNNRYPIVDTNIKLFMKKHGFSVRKNYSNRSRSYKEFYEDFIKMMIELKWPRQNVETFDIAIWELMMAKKRKKRKMLSF